MFLKVLPEYRSVWAEALKCYLPTTVRIGYRAETLDGRVLSYGKTRPEAILNAIEQLRAEQAEGQRFAPVGMEIYRREKHDAEIDTALLELFAIAS